MEPKPDTSPRPPTAEAALTALQRIAAACEAMDAKLATLLLRGTSQPTPAATSAPDADLDSQWGNPVIKAKSPRDWAGEPMTGRRFSECPPEYLDLLDARFEFFNGRETDEKKRGYNTRDAARAHGWAARLRAGWTELRVRSEPQSGTLDRGTRDSIARDPNHQVALHSLLDLSAKWECDVDLRYVAPIQTQAVPGYTECDLRLGWRPSPAWELSLLGQNLLHPRHAEFNTPGARRELQRAIFGKASWRF